jgi:hypothetical protein
MKIYLTSNIPIPTLRETYTHGPPADFLIDDLLVLCESNDTNFVNELEIALEQLKSRRIKYIYELEIKELDGKTV